MTLRVIDTETCGLDGGVVEVASLDLLDGQLTNPMSDLVSPDRPISLDAMAIHHITEQMVEGKPRIAVAIGRYQGSPYYVAHNAAFDRGVLPEMNGAGSAPSSWRARCIRTSSTATNICATR